MGEYVEFIANAGACLTTRNVMEGRGRVRWMVREGSQREVDNGWRFFSVIDTDEYLADSSNWVVVGFNEVCAIEPALIGVYDFPVGSDLQIVDGGSGIEIVDTDTGEVIPRDQWYVPGAPVRQWGASANP